MIDHDGLGMSKFAPDTEIQWRVMGLDNLDPDAPHSVAVLNDGTVVVFREGGGQAQIIDPATGEVTGAWGPVDLGASPEARVGPDGVVSIFSYEPMGIRIVGAAGTPIAAWVGGDLYPAPTFPGDGFGYTIQDGKLVRVKLVPPG